MDAFLGFFSFIQGLGVSVMMPIVLTILGCILGAGFGKSLRAGLTVGVGFIGLGLVINSLLGTTLSPAVQEMVNRFGLSLTVVDVGWPAAAAIAMGSTVGLIIIPLGLVVNIVMLLTNTTQTVDVDIWDYWHFAFTGALVSIVTNSYVFGIIAAILNMIVIMVLGDYTAPLVEESLQMPGVSLPHGFTTAYAPIAMLFNWIFDKIPGVRDIDINTDTLQKKFGVFGEPILVGTVIGLVIGVLAYWDGGNVAASITKVLSLGVSLGAVLVLIPKMAALLMEGLLPISDAASTFVNKHFKNRGKIYIGLDSAVGVGHPVTLAISFILVPLCIFLAVILPGNKVLPFADLAVIPWMFVLITPVVRNNGFRGIFIGLIVLTVGLYIATDLSPLITTAASNVQFDMGGAAAISSICDGANPLTWLIVRIGGIANGLGLAIIGIATLALAIWNKRRIHKEALELHTSDTAE
ncbi:PTS galactitol transporter subunit IIC [Lancefieldella rimae]|jgi:PTS system, IIc component|uniref:PTS sugar transporter subunit IIC n=1 Tax=Rothia dentocariosa TaxID=2047 RepID=A0A930KQ93_9MICC|nr:PTS transporter subunit IIC [Lancefieldella rimae]MBF1650606.1 PTS sugar transporter subunit IIC [Rothia dentocariosa]MBF4803671.1 PTS sugar transporter subunit IIC [Lancefieldella rimae]MDU5528694.1 PTS transporter subunit IIC [Atopobium sp.]OFR22675.1 DNA mismatch repair protein MutT [Atopobium sp. HMSC064B08]